MANQRITEDFVRHFKLLFARTGGSPENIGRALNRDPLLATSIMELDRIWGAVERHRNTSKRRFIVQTHPEFWRSIEDYGKRWSHAFIELCDWEDKKAGRGMAPEEFDALLRDSKSRPDANTGPIVQDRWDFEIEEDSPADLVASAADYMAKRADDEPWFSRADGAFKWFTNTVGLDFSAIEERFREFPVLIVPEHVSNRHGIEDDRSLFAYLNNVRLAYIVGAELAAIAMCRACTEILIRCHYNQDSDLMLTRLTRDTQEKRDFAFLKRHNLIAKVEEANQLLHFNHSDIETKNRSRLLIREWVTALQEIIARAPYR